MGRREEMGSKEKGKSIMRIFLLWLVDNVPLGRLTPYIFGMAIKSKPVKIESIGGKE